MAMTEPVDELIVRIDRHGTADTAASDGPSRKRADIVRAATALFLRQGYHDTGTDQIAAAASVSKQTVYNQFGDKKRLFHDIVIGVTATAERFAAGVADGLGGGRDAAD